MTFAFLYIFAPFAVVLTVVYVLIIVTYRKGWNLLPSFDIPRNYQPKTKVSVLIPARNEEANIVACLQSVLAQNMDKSLYEVIVIDDHSTDETANLVCQSAAQNVRLLQLADYISPNETQSFKKKAIEIAINEAKGDLIVTTDADCIVAPQWLSLIASFYELKKVKFIAAPVAFHRETNLLQRFQTLDFFGMMCVTGAGVHLRLMNMCNGANLAYEKEAFYAVEGFNGINNLASGDDILLMHKIAKKYPDSIGFLKNKRATVYTDAKEKLADFIAQRIRWGTKSANYQEWRVTAILAAVFFHCWCVVFSFLLILFFGKWALALFFFQFFIKSIVDFIYLNMMSKWFEKPEGMRVFWQSEIMHILYICFIGTAANFFKTYEWKGRKVK